MAEEADGVLEPVIEEVADRERIGEGHQPDDYLEELIRYYSQAGPDYKSWSPSFNMHFGYYRSGMNPLRLEPQLEAMNAEVFERLAWSPQRDGHLLDMGCGLGATTRSGARSFPNTRFTGITIVPWQVEQATRFNQSSGLADRIGVKQADYTQTPFSEQSFDGAYAVESSCYAAGFDKRAFLLEAFRILKPGARLVVADGFLKDRNPMNPFLRFCYEKICACWSLDTFAEVNAFREALTEIGFRDIRFEEISWQIAPSVLHIPRVTLWFLLSKVLFGREPMNRKRWDNVIAPALGMLVGLARRRYGYFLVSAAR